MTDTVIESIRKNVGNAAVLINEPMSKHTTFKIGGTADILVEPESADCILAVLEVLKNNNISFFVMGNGSNLLVADSGIKGAVIKISNSMSAAGVDGEYIEAECGIKLSRLANLAQSSSLTGLEFASGIPGTLGGALFMNAGAYGGEMRDVVKSVTYLDIKSGELKTISGDECEFGYRHSIFSKVDAVIISARLKLASGDAEEIRKTMNELAQRRNEKQPVDKPSAGSTFKRPEGHFAGTMIPDCGLKGYRIGGAEVSRKHAGFIINAGGATAKDVRDLIEYVQDTVEDKFSVRLEPEVRFVGEF
ncbi:MAG: UDP-N-acetylmuramate dehydrogenase [Clostridia bacterium]|nr:UDP-N-acetylmuramate dehydrogenase [Clostridia bacterium]